MSEQTRVMGRYATPAEYAVVSRCAAKTGYCVSDEHIIAVLQESGHTELVAVLCKVREYAWANRVGLKDEIDTALRKAGAL